MVKNPSEIVAILGPFTLGLHEFVEQLGRENLSPREFFERLLSTASDSTTLLDEMPTWSDEFLLDVVLQWLDREGIPETMPSNSQDLVGLQAVLIDYVNDVQAALINVAALGSRSHMISALDELKRTTSLADLARNLRVTDEMLKSIAVKPLRNSITVQANIIDTPFVTANPAQSLASATNMLSEIGHVRFIENGNIIANLIGTKDSLDGFANWKDQLLGTRALLHAANLSALSEALIAPITLDNIGALIGLHGEHQRTLGSLFDDTLSSFATSTWEVAGTDNLTNDFKPRLLESAARGTFSVSDLASVITFGVRDNDVSVGVEAQREELAEEYDDFIRQCLYSLNPEWRNKYDGALQATMTSNVDKVRHVSASLRELLREIMHDFATEKDVVAWSDDPQHFHVDKHGNRVLTNKARLLYLFRHVHQPPLEGCFSTQIEFILQVIKELHANTHGSSDRITCDQLNAIVVSVKWAIHTLLTVGGLAVGAQSTDFPHRRT
jgi:hypothetical protein